MVEEFFMAPFTLILGLMGMLIGIISLAVTIYAFYDILFQQPDMGNLEKLIWVIVVIVFNIFGVLLYFVIVKYMDDNPVAEAISSDREHKKINDLERLADLKDRGMLTEEEFQAEKQRILGNREENEDAPADRKDAETPQ